ncbi:proton-conducting transporter membrane subunit [Desulfuromonas sp. AOP6]|uniref:complex I subunit 5 family protein n=1 Tax=Desulfuromonas sp. AOP6 TaxID=1566351 RepID=UPI0012848665|nr:proton-conducting transporter membrane subunit [Desulfuromonas sp. AOP6]BCA78294.1 cation:proton antiporter [Desulfuromonas sp. AOP6]
MTSTNLHLYVLAAPLLTAFAVNLLGRASRRWIAPLALGALSFSAIGAVLLLLRVLRDGGFSYTVGNWRAPFGIELLIDPLSALMLVLIAAVALPATVSALKSVEQELPGQEYLFFTQYLILIAGLMGLVLTADAFNLYVLLEITSITTYGLIAMGKGRAPLASFNYIIMGSIGACFYLLGVGYLYILTGSLNMADIAGILGTMQESPALATAFAFMLVGLWVKMAFFPLHGWLPQAYSLAPTGAGLLIAPLMTKVTVYLMIRVILSVFTPDYAFFQHAVVQSGIVWVAAAAILCASALALAQRDMRRMLTYIIIAEVGYMVGGVWLANANGLTGAILHIVNDALMTLCLFLAAAAIIYRTGSLEFSKLQGLYRKMPITMAAFTVGAFSMIGVPPTCGFFSKWYLILGGIDAGQWGFVAALVISSLVNAILFFRIIEKGFFFAPGEEHGHGQAGHGEVVAEAPAQMLQPLVLVAIALIVVGLSSGTIVDKVIRLALPASF